MRALLHLLRVPLALVAMASGIAVPASARADDKEACVAASEQAQTLRDDGKYRAARAAMNACARDACPGIVRRDCEKWLADLDASQPTLVLGARDPRGSDVPGTRVSLDGAPFVDRLDGKPVAVDPGEHVFRYEAPGTAPVEQRVVVRVNEKNRVLTAILMPPAPPSPAPAALPPSPSPVEPLSSSEPARARVPVASWVLIGVTAAAVGSFAYFGLSGRSDVDGLRASCAPDCSQGQVDAARTKLIVADVSLGVGVLSLGTAAWFFFHRGGKPAPTTTGLANVGVEARGGGGVATLTARF